MKRNAMALTLAASVLLSGAVALAFPFGKSWHDPANGAPSNGGRAGAGGIYGMGGATVSERPVATEDVRFKLPPEVRKR